jgi:hypothetical protein
MLILALLGLVALCIFNGWLAAVVPDDYLVYSLLWGGFSGFTYGYFIVAPLLSNQ